MDDQEIVERITKLVDEEHELRAHVKSGSGLGAAEQARIQELEVQLDQCWDLLRRRQARVEFGQDPEQEEVQPSSVVENYRQ